MGAPQGGKGAAPPPPGVRAGPPKHRAAAGLQRPGGRAPGGAANSGMAELLERVRDAGVEMDRVKSKWRTWTFRAWIQVQRPMS
ncbi:unnamed protein product [Prorocentrum cordatum]|uniref:Uncharacterized protein n=1 Tax=Prorocentrum cordatum TaxID=2364126 RepID=A0ABN9R5B6_9DINO|nr:unnamed protein product [Polarella glacialis]